MLCVNRHILKAFHKSGGIASDHDVRRNICGNNGSRSNHCTLSDIRENYACLAQPTIGSNFQLLYLHDRWSAPLTKLISFMHLAFA
jgi:hypothetical protein